MKQTKAQRLANAKKPTKDGYQNLAARVGTSGAADNMSSSGTYTINPLTRNRAELEAMYRGSWVVGAAVDAPADDMIRAGIDFSAGFDPSDAAELHAAFDHLNVWTELGDAMRWGRLYGGSIAVMLIDGQDFATPLRPETIGKGQFKGLMAVDRWQLQPSIADVVTDLGPSFGKPAHYVVISDEASSKGLKSPLLHKKIHHSRILRFEGHKLPHYQRMAEQGWGMSVIERLFDRLMAFDSATQGTAQLVFKAHLRTLAVRGLTEIVAQGGVAYAALSKRVSDIRKFQSSEGLTLIDSTDKLEVSSYTFSGLDDVIMQFAQQISGALQIPLVRLLGQSPAGLNSSGDADLRTYYDGINRDQERNLRAPMTLLLELLHRSVLGREPEKDFSFTFNSLWQMTDNEKADLAVKVSTVVREQASEGIITPEIALKELKKSSAQTGIFTSITEQDIEDAANAPPPVSELEMDPNESFMKRDPADLLLERAKGAN